MNFCGLYFVSFRSVSVVMCEIDFRNLAIGLVMANKFSHPAEVSVRRQLSEIDGNSLLPAVQVELVKIRLSQCKLGQFEMFVCMRFDVMGYPLPNNLQFGHVGYFKACFWRRFMEVGTPSLTASSPGVARHS